MRSFSKRTGLSTVRTQLLAALCISGLCVGKSTVNHLWSPPNATEQAYSILIHIDHPSALCFYSSYDCQCVCQCMVREIALDLQDIGAVLRIHIRGRKLEFG